MNSDIPRDCIELLHELNASDIQFFERNILSHLEGTYRILREWNASNDLAIAGLFHAVYLTEFFVTNEPHQATRTPVRTVIGPEAEALAYSYCVMDRAAFAGQDRSQAQGFLDSYAGAFVELSTDEDHKLMELIWANAIEQVRANNSSFKENAPLRVLFEASRHRVSTKAIAAFEMLK